MKAINFFVFVFCTFMSFAQTASNDASFILENEVLTQLPDSHLAKGELKYNFSPKLNLLTTQQVKKHLRSNVEYPELMIVNGVEGTAVVKIVLSGNGQIVDYHVVKSPQIAFDNAIKKAMRHFNKIDTKGQIYRGIHKIHVPVEFSLVN